MLNIAATEKWIYIIFIAASIRLVSYPQNDSTETPTDIFSEIAENISEDTEEETDYIPEKLEELRDNPVDLNKADIFKLRQIPLITPGLAEEIINYRLKRGRIFSLKELLLLEGFKRRLLDEISPFIKISNNDFSRSERKTKHKDSRIKLELRSRMIYNLIPKEGFEKKKFLGSRPKFYNRIKLKYGYKAGLNILSEKDEGEKKLNDFASLSIWGKDISFLKDLIIGDFYIEAGQGLVLWSAYTPPSGLNIFYSAMRNHAGIKPYTSSGENGFFRGIAGSVVLRKVKMTAFYSDNFIDANIDSSSGLISSLNSDGYHRTENEIKKKDCCREISYGFIAEYYIHNLLKTGIVIFNTSLNKPLELKYARASDRFMNYSFFYDLYFESLTISGEAAYNGFQPAFINSFRFFITKKIVSIISLRYYNPFYGGIHAMGFGNGSGTGNEIGYYAGISLRNNAGKFIFSYDTYKNPRPVYNTLFPAQGWKAAAAWLPPEISKSEIRIRYNISRSEIRKAVDNHYAASFRIKNKIRFDLKKSLKNISLKSEIDYTWLSSSNKDNLEDGFMVYQDLLYSPTSFLLISGRIVLFRTDSFQTALYVFENDFYGVFKNNALFGNGDRWYLLLKFTLLKGFKLSLKYSETVKPFLKSMGTGYSAINGNTDDYFGCQIDVNL